MKKKHPFSPLLGLAILAFLGIVIFLFGTPCVFRAADRAAMAEAVGNGKQVKLALDSFAMDHNGAYPIDDLALKHKCPNDGSTNALFRQLFANGNTRSERIFWAKGSAVCTKRAPDDVTVTKGSFDPSETLKPGDCGWAYVRNQTNVDNPSRPLLVDSPPAASGLTFDPDLWDGKVIVVRIDSSAIPHRLDPHNRLLDGDNKELLTTASQVWGSSTTEVEIAYPLKPNAP